MNMHSNPRSASRPALLALASTLLWALAACGGGDPPPDKVTEQVSHNWRFAQHHSDGSTVDVGAPGSSTDKEVHAVDNMGPIPLVPRRADPEAVAEAYSTAAGDTYWVSTQAPHGDIRKPSSAIGSFVYLDQIQTFRKTSDAASMDLVVSESTLEVLDSNPFVPTGSDCPYLVYVPFALKALAIRVPDCGNLIDTNLSYQILAWKEVPIKDANGVVTGFGKVDLAHGSVFAHLYGYLKDEFARAVSSTWHFDVGSSGDSNLHFKVAPDFHYDDNVERDADATHAAAYLNRPTIITIPLDAVNKDEEFKVIVVVTADVNNRRQFESFASARFRDPQKLSGVTYQSQGVAVVAVPAGTVSTPPSVDVPAAPACTTGTDPAAGTLQFRQASIYTPESTGQGQFMVWVTRSGGSAGEVTARFATTDGSARAGVDYGAVSTRVRFADGEQGQRFVAVPIIDNTLKDGARTVTLTLSDVQGCAALGSSSTAVLTIADDDDPPLPPATFALGGTVTGLAGSGLVLQTAAGDRLQPAGNGAFVFAARLGDASGYSVSVATQPGNPVQLCTVTGGSGTVAGSDVTSIAVDCVTPPANGALDTAFGSGGKVTTTQLGAKALALQSDGKLLALGGMTLSRFNADGSLDAAFASAGVRSIVANGGPFDAMQALAVQPDGKIVVAGYTALPTALTDDIVVLRFNNDGSPDLGFGSGGKVVTDVAGSTDRAHAVAVQADGRIVIAGIATLGSGVNLDQDVALVRYLADGSLDASFGNGGKVTTNVGGRTDFGYAIALQADGRIVVAGRVGINGGTNPDIGVLRYLANGSLDTSFGSGGSRQIDFGGGSWDEAGDVLVQPDGRILVGGLTSNGGSYRYALLRLNGDGTPDVGFATQGIANTAFTTQGDYGHAIALQSDGRIVVAGQVASLGNGDFGIARYGSDGSLDAAFGQGGLVRVDFFGSVDAAFDVLVQNDGKIVAGGLARNGTSVGLALARVLP